MEVKPGYKQTEMGVIPGDWDAGTMAFAIDKLEAGTSVNSEKQDKPDFESYPCVLKTGAAAGGTLNPQECKKVTRRDLPRLSLSLRKDTILISRMNTIELVGESAHVDADYPTLFVPDRLWMATIRAPVSSLWLSYVLTWDSVKSQISASATGTSGSMKNISKPSLRDIRIAYPPIAEQRAIAAALSDVDALLGGLDRLIAKKRDLKQAAMQQLLTGQTRLPGFNGKWVVEKLKQVAEISNGINKPHSEMGGGALYVTVQDLYDNTSIRTERLSRIRVSPSEIESRSLAIGDIVFGKSSVKRDGIGYPSQFLGCDEPVVFSGFTYRARARRGIADSAFLFYALRAEKTRRWLVDNSQASALTNINQTIADAIPVNVPPTVPEQTAIAEVLTAMDAELSALEARREKTRDLKRGMMQELLTGRTRLL